MKLIFKILRKIFEGTNILNIGFFKWIRNLMFNMVKKEYVYIDGFKIKLDSKDSLRLSLNPNYEELIVKTMKEIVKPEDNVFDIGANIGYYSLILGKLVGKDGSVTAFEPDKDNFNLLLENVINNNYMYRINPMNMAVSNTNDSVKLFLNKDNLGDHRLIDDGNREYNIVCCTKLDNYINNKKVSLVKIDVQGCETRVLQGGEKFFENNHNIKIITECWNYGLKRAGSSAEEYLTMLSIKGFKFKLLDKKVIPISIKEILNSNYVEDKNYCNLLCER